MAPAADRFPSAAELLRRFGARAKRSLGQNFLTDPSILDRLADAAGVGSSDRVLEVGPGPGTLTRTLLGRGCEVVAIELDDRAVHHLAEALRSAQLNVIRGDVLALDLGAIAPSPTAVVANLPYNIATETFFRLDTLVGPTRMLLMFQSEVAGRFVAHRGTKAYGPLALLSSIRWRAALAVRLPPGAFIPRPKVHSAAVRFERRDTPLVPAPLEPIFRRLVREAFQQRRKTIRNALSRSVTLAQLETAEIAPGLRPERLSSADFRRLAEAVTT